MWFLHRRNSVTPSHQTTDSVVDRGYPSADTEPVVCCEGVATRERRETTKDPVPTLVPSLFPLLTEESEAEEEEKERVI